jgi:site-specific DNA-methyltransferase (adenine-specific)
MEKLVLKGDNNRYKKSKDCFEFVIESKSLHPTQKPVPLLEYLIKTYTNEGDTVLDFTMGSGSTGVACKNTNRNFIGIEMDKNYFDIAKNRIETTLI